MSIQSGAARFVRWGLWLVVLSLPGIGAAGAQEPQQQGQQQEEKQQAATDESSSRRRQAENDPHASLPHRPVLVDSNTGKPLNQLSSPFRWNRFSLLSFEALYLYDDVNFPDRPNLIGRAVALRGQVAYTFRRRATELTFNYRPQVMFNEDRRITDLTGQALDFQTYTYLNRWLILRITDQLTYLPARVFIADPSFTPSFDTSTIIQRPFLAAGRNFLVNTSEESFEFLITPRDRLSLSATQQFVRVSERTGPLGEPLPSDSDPFKQSYAVVGGGLGWTHQWSSRHEVGLRYQYERHFFRGFDEQAQFHGFLFTLNSRLRPSVRLRATFGPTVWVPGLPPGAPARPSLRYTYEGSLALFKQFRSTSLVTVSYTRRHDFSGVLSGYVYDRYEASYTRQWNQRLQTTVGVSYLRHTIPGVDHLNGWTGWTRISYRLSRSWTAIASYLHLASSGTLNGQRPFSSRHVLISGLSWAWRPETEARD